MSAQHVGLIGWPAVSSRKVPYEAKFWLVVLLLTGSVFFAYARLFSWSDPYRSLATFMAGAERGDVYRPFVYRVLLPLLSEAARRIVPLDPMVYQIVWMYLSFLGFIVALRSLAQTFWEPSRRLDYAVLFAIPLVIPWSIEVRYFYDLPVLCLFTWGIVCVARRRWTWLLVCYSVACFNKETTVLLTVMFAVCYAQEHRSGWYWRLIGMQIGIYGCVRGALLYIFRQFPGQVVEYHVMDHILVYLHHPVKTCACLIAIGLFVLLMIYDLRSKPVFLKRALLAVLPLMVALYCLFGFPYEFRVFYEVYGLIILLCVPSRYCMPRSAVTLRAASRPRASGAYLPRRPAGDPRVLRTHKQGLSEGSGPSLPRPRPLRISSAQRVRSASFGSPRPLGGRNKGFLEGASSRTPTHTVRNCARGADAAGLGRGAVRAGPLALRREGRFAIRPADRVQSR